MCSYEVHFHELPLLDFEHHLRSVQIVEDTSSVGLSLLAYVTTFDEGASLAQKAPNPQELLECITFRPKPSLMMSSFSHSKRSGSKSELVSSLMNSVRRHSARPLPRRLCSARLRCTLRKEFQAARQTPSLLATLQVSKHAERTKVPAVAQRPTARLLLTTDRTEAGTWLGRVPGKRSAGPALRSASGHFDVTDHQNSMLGAENRRRQQHLHHRRACHRVRHEATSVGWRRVVSPGWARASSCG